MMSVVSCGANKENTEQQQSVSNATLSLPDHWQQISDSNNTQYYKLGAVNGGCQVVLHVQIQLRRVCL